jgi:predicted histidine transporter YuiF (NhaC family)
LEQDFPSYFTLAVEYALAASFALAIARDEAMAQMMERKAQQLMQQAKTLDSQQQTTRRLVTSRFISERRS